MMKRITRTRGLQIGATTLLATLLACNATTPPADSVVMVVREPPRPTLTAARNAQVTMFGGLPRRGEASYTGRMLGSMLPHSYTREGADFDARLDRDGNRIIFSSTRHSPSPDIYIKSVSGTAVTQLTLDPSSDIQPAFSPDDRLIAFASDRTGNWDIWVVGIDGRAPVQITNSPMDELHPSWSPDGSQLVYCARPQTNGPWELWLSPAKKNATPTYIGVGLFPEWSPTDNRILFQRARERGSRWFSIWTLELANGEPRYPTEIASSADYAMILPAWSRDAGRIAYTTVNTLPDADPEFGAFYETSDIWVIEADGASRVRVTDGQTTNFGPTWAPDGRVFFTSSRAGHENIWSVMPATPADMSQPMKHGAISEAARPGTVIPARSSVAK
jgi:TolB protein